MNLLKSLAAVSSITMVSRVLGFARDTIIARTFGAGMATDAFFIAFKLPNLLRRIFAEGAFSQAFVPILAEYKSQQGEEATRTFVAYVTGLLTLALALLAAHSLWTVVEEIPAALAMLRQLQRGSPMRGRVTCSKTRRTVSSGKDDLRPRPGWSTNPSSRRARKRWHQRVIVGQEKSVNRAMLSRVSPSAASRIMRARRPSR